MLKLEGPRTLALKVMVYPSLSPSTDLFATHCDGLALTQTSLCVLTLASFIIINNNNFLKMKRHFRDTRSLPLVFFFSCLVCISVSDNLLVSE